MEVCRRVLAAVLVALGLLAAAHAAPAREDAVAAISPKTFDFPEASFGRIGSDPQAALPYLIVCLTHLQRHDYRPAVAACSEALARDPENADGYRMRGAGEMALHLLGAAIADFDRAILLAPDNADGYALRATADREKDDFAAAIANFSKAIALRPTDDRLWNGRCWVRALWGKGLAQALFDCRKAFALEPTRASTLDSIGFISLRLRRYRDAWRHYDAALILDPTLPSALFGRGLSAYRLYGTARAQTDIAAAFRLNAQVAGEFIAANLIAQNSPLIRCQGKPCAPALPRSHPQRKESQPADHPVGQRLTRS